MHDFTYTGHAGRVVFGVGALAHLGREIEALGAQRALVLCTPEQAAQAERVADLLGARAAGVFARAQMHVPIETARQARDEARRLGADCAVAIGGGSTTGLGKAIALDSGLPVLAIPTTYAGSEVTTIYGLTEGGLKKTGRDARVLPRTVIYDPELTLSLPVGLSVTSGLNAIAHAAEGLYAQDRNPVTDLMAAEGIAALGRALPGIRANPRDLAARSDALYGAWLCGMVLNGVGMALHHKLCHTLGGSFNLPHAEVHAVVLPHAIAFNAPAAREAMGKLGIALRASAAQPASLQVGAPLTNDPAQALWRLAQDNGAPMALRELGMREADLDRAADLAVANPYWNPRPFGPAQRGELRALLQRAWAGEPPQTGDAAGFATAP